MGVAKSFGTEVVLRDASFVLNAGEKVGLVGENGVGKSTLLRIIAGQIVPDAGRVVVGPDITVGYLPQEVPLVPGQTIAGLLAKADELQAKLADPQFYMRDRAGFEKVTSDLGETQRKLAAAEERWLQLEILREEITGG